MQAAFFKEAEVFGSVTLMEIVIHTVCFCVFCPFVVMLFKRTIDRIFEIDEPKLWRTIWLIPLFSTILVMIITENPSNENVLTLKFVVARLIIIINMLLVYGTLLNSLNNIKEQIILREKDLRAKQLTAMYKRQYEMLKSNIYETRKARHNLKQHLNLIQAYIDKNDHKALKEYVEKYGKTLPKNINGSFSLNYAVNVILSYYAEKAAERGIIFTTNIRLPERVDIPEPTLCVLFGNLLENAVEACEGYKDKKPFIRICSALVSERVFSVTVDNSCFSEPVYENGDIVSSKGSGMGIYSVKVIAEQYDGTAEFEYKDGVFYASILLNL